MLNILTAINISLHFYDHFVSNDHHLKEKPDESGSLVPNNNLLITHYCWPV